MSVTLSKDGPAIAESATRRRAYEQDARDGSQKLRAMTLRLFERHAKRIKTDWAEAGARLLAGVGQ